MASVLTVVSCRWDWCRASFSSIDALDIHVKHDHIWPMKPMQRAEIALMRKLDLQSLHSSQNTDSSIIFIGPTAGLSRSNPPPPSTPQAYKHPEIEEFDTFAQLSSPPQAHSPQRLPNSPAFEGLMRQNGHSGLSAAVEMFGRHRANQHLRLPSHQHSPTHRPLSQSSGSSQEVVEQQLTQEDDVASQSLLPPQTPIELTDIELRWPSEDELDVLAAEETRNLEQPVSEQICPLVPTRGQEFCCGSLTVPLGVNVHSTSPPISLASQVSHSPSQPLQTQAPYSSQPMGQWSQT